MDSASLTLIIFILTYTGIIFTRLPWINIDRPSAAFFGAIALIVSGCLTLPEAVAAVDFNTIALLLGMMIIISTLQLDGFFSLLAAKTIAWSGTQRRLLTIIVLVTAIASAFLVNDAVVLIFTPVILSICRSSGRNPLPYLIGEILACNVGSVMTMTGNPQNMLIGINSGMDYHDFMLRLLPVTLLSLPVVILAIRLLYRSEFRKKEYIRFSDTGFQYHFSSMKWSVPVFFLTIIMFFFSPAHGLSLPVIALAGGSLILIVGRIKPSRIIRQVDWVLLLFFASLFIVVHAVEKEGLLGSLAGSALLQENTKGLIKLHAVSLVLSQIVSNVPFTVIMLPVMKASGSEVLWLALASASTLAGNATIIGAMANLIVIESAEKEGVKIRFMEFLKPGLIVTIVSLMLSVAVLALEFHP
ncbi:MAG TPA: SLC13 family permease [Bacteroidales bacterium]|nr:SLC13 family permease [Bacteroidales bacterium]HSA43706.1 SLC13 family permease [Bacteroidales bacterium]